MASSSSSTGASPPPTPISFASVLESCGAGIQASQAGALLKAFSEGVEIHASRFAVDVFPPEIGQSLKETVAEKRASIGPVAAAFQSAISASMGSTSVQGLGSLVNSVLDLTIVLGLAGSGKSAASSLSSGMVRGVG